MLFGRTTKNVNCQLKFDIEQENERARDFINQTVRGNELGATRLNSNRNSKK